MRLAQRTWTAERRVEEVLNCFVPPIRLRAPIEARDAVARHLEGRVTGGAVVPLDVGGKRAIGDPAREKPPVEPPDAGEPPVKAAQKRSSP